MDITKMTGQEVMEIIKDHWFTWEETKLEAYHGLEENITNQKAFHDYHTAHAIHRAIEWIILEVEDEDEELEKEIKDLYKEANRKIGAAMSWPVDLSLILITTENAYTQLRGAAADAINTLVQLIGVLEEIRK